MKVTVLALLSSLLVTVIALAAVIVDHMQVSAAPMARESLTLHATATSAPATAHLAVATVPATAAPAPAVTATAPVPAKSANGCAITSDQLAAEQHLLALINQHRAAAGVPLLTLDPTLSAGARTHSCDMALHGLLSHNGSDNSTPFQRIQAEGVTYHSAGENIGTATNYGLIGGVDVNDQAMMAEPLTCCNHHWNIVNKAYTSVGIGIIYRNGTEWLTEDFVG